MREVGNDLGQQLVDLVLAAVRVNQQHAADLVRRRAQDTKGNGPAGDPFEIGPRQAEPLGGAAEPGIELSAEVVNERLELWIGHQLAKLRFVPPGSQCRNVGHDDERLCRLGDQLLRAGWCGQAKLDRSGKRGE
ncbi:MAG: hypothetical protein WD468_13240 [Pirellulales bacterium]